MRRRFSSILPLLDLSEHIAELWSKTMEAKKVPGFYAIGEAGDVTSWLSGHNFQRAWSSGWVAGEAM